MKLRRLQTREIFRKKSHFFKKLAVFACLSAVLTVGVYSLVRVFDSKINNGNSIINLKSKWKLINSRSKWADLGYNDVSEIYKDVYDISAAILYKSPFNTSARTYNGYAAFFLAVSQSDLVQALNYIDESINSLRIALQTAKFSSVAQIEYMLGKAYFYKNFQSSYYYYADLAVDYLLKAKKDGYKPSDPKNDDIPELLGLSYASLGMTMESISAFTEALLVRESDILLLSIAEQYHNVGQDNAAEQYLYRISQDCKDEQVILKSHLLLGNIYLDRGLLEEAEREFNFILEKNENSADAYYGLGVIYENQGDSAKARAEWRKALRVQNNHPLALKKMADLK
ncbi:tetratricopeptide repeat protein [uncultured Treponema sp.]|uniref:tetratricopeptide repeat protein n=1 Tax=uncultured Treponema sp. TaxID=162155 RepID=UPI0025E93D75|nr:tetratricopeptide repeat protein [uncultured Treponema sp.]